MARYKVVLRGLADPSEAGKEEFLARFSGAYKMGPDEARDRILRMRGVLYHFPNQDGAEKARSFLESIGGVAAVEVEEQEEAPPLAMSVAAARPAPDPGWLDGTEASPGSYGMKRCPQCGFEVPLNDDQCPSCGTSISEYRRTKGRRVTGAAAAAEAAETSESEYGPPEIESAAAGAGDAATDYGPPDIENGVAATGFPTGTPYNPGSYAGAPRPGAMYSGPASAPVQAAELSPYAGKSVCPEASKALIGAAVGFFLFGFILGIYAVVKGVEAIGEINKNPQYTGKGLAIAAIGLGVFDVIAWMAAMAQCAARIPYM